LNNALYIGRYIWNRSAWKNDPDTQKRTRKDLPREQWVIHEKPELRLVDDDLWFAVRARIDAKNLKPGKGKGRPARTLFGGQLRCPQCFGAFIAVNSRSYGCVRRKDQGPQACSNKSFVRRAVVDGGLLDVVRQEVLSEAESVRFEQELRARLAAESNAGRAQSAQYLSKQLTETSEQIFRLVDGIKTVGMSAALSTALVEAERAKEDISRRLAVARQPRLDTERAVRKAVADYVKNVAELEAALNDEVDLAREALRQLLGRITIIVDEDGTVWAAPENKTARTPSGDGLSLNLVAGAGFEPTTSGL
jgi:site-specific DNA recombinase